MGQEEETYCSDFETGAIAWGGMRPQEAPFECLVQLRSRHTPAAATITPRRTGAQVTFHEPERAVTPGQWAVFYDLSGYVLASGMVQRFRLVEASTLAR